MSHLSISEVDGVAPDHAHSARRTAPLTERPRVAGKSLFAGREKLWVRGATYGTFRPDERGNEHGQPRAVERDFAEMAAHGLNAVRVYTVPPRWLLDAAQRCGLRVMVGLPWEQHIAFLEEGKRAREIVERVRLGVRACAGHPAVLGYAIGNEIPAPIVRWYGPQRVERFLKCLHRVAKCEDAEGLVTYVNYPTTEYLKVPFVDFMSFNVYLESQDRLEAYLARLHNLAADQPVVMTEIGFDSLRNGMDLQAEVLSWQIRSTFASGCAGAFVFGWTDEWYRGGYDIEDWDFGLTTRDRRPKPAAAAVQRAFAEIPSRPSKPWPRISVVVCTYNGARTIRDTLEGVCRLDYPNFEVIVVNDGSNDLTPLIARRYGVRLISTENRGLASARNTGLEAATGEIVAYIDDDASPDPHWLTFLAQTFLTSDHAGVGGPNIAPPGDGWIADCVANAPGGPMHVLLSDTEADHIPGCNSAFRKECLQAIGGYDPQFRAAGDDVDVCWRLQQRGWTLGFNPGAVVWHHRRNSIRAYWKQQKGYGKAEALLERKWPEKFNGVGHITWAGRIYGRGLTQPFVLGKRRIYHGIWGAALFQSVYEPAPDGFLSFTLTPEWYLVCLCLAALFVLGAAWSPLLLGLPLLLLAAMAPVAHAGVSAARARFPTKPRTRAGWLGLVCFTACLHLLQPMARLWGRLCHGLTPWRRRGAFGWVFPRRREIKIWHEEWRSAEARLARLEAALRSARTPILRGGDFDRWDLETRGGMLGAARVLMAIEEHGAGRQYARFRIWPRWSPVVLSVVAAFAAFSVSAGIDGAWLASAALGVAALTLGAAAMYEAGAAEGALVGALSDPLSQEQATDARILPSDGKTC